MLLPESIRDRLVEDLDEYLNNLPDDPDVEMVATFIIEQLEVYADEKGIDDIVVGLEESGGLDSTLQEFLESEMDSNDDFEFTGEECVALLEAACEIEWEEEEEDLEEEEEEVEEGEEEPPAEEEA